MKVYVGMSGGVDSSLTAALLKEQGHDVTGVYMKNWTEDLPGMRCPWADDLADAKRVAVQLGIDLKVYDFETEYKQKVVNYLLVGSELGRMPPSDIMCNQEVKFKLFLETALEDGAEMIATGHYARVEHGVGRFSTPSFPGTAARPSSLEYASGSDGAVDVPGKEVSSARLLLAKDANKDQTYFLYRITGEALVRTLFPLGEYTKTEVREVAAARNLYTASK